MGASSSPAPTEEEEHDEEEPKEEESPEEHPPPQATGEDNVKASKAKEESAKGTGTAKVESSGEEKPRNGNARHRAKDQGPLRVR